MEIYIYGTYQRSAMGFTPMKYEAGRLAAIPPGGSAQLPPEVDAFFSYDCFRVLWQEIISGGSHGKLLFPNPDHALLGIRNLHGQVSGREAYINVVFWTDISEEGLLRKLLLWMLDDYREFMSGLIECLYLEEEGYQMRGETYDAWLQRAGKRRESISGEEMSEEQRRVRRLVHRQRRPVTERDLLRFALCTSTWQEVQNFRYQEAIWKIPPRSVFEGQYFAPIFGTDQD